MAYMSGLTVVVLNFFLQSVMLNTHPMTWDEGLRYIAAERSERRMKEEALTNHRVVHPPRLPNPFDARMTDNSSAFDETVTSATEPSPPVSPPLEGVDPPVTSARLQMSSPSQWMQDSRHLDLALLTVEERRDLMRRMQDPNCRFRRHIAEDPVTSMMWAVLLSAGAGVVLGMNIASSVSQNRYRSKATFRHATTVPQTTPSVKTKVIDKMMSFLN